MPKLFSLYCRPNPRKTLGLFEVAYFQFRSHDKKCQPAPPFNGRGDNGCHLSTRDCQMRALSDLELLRVVPERAKAHSDHFRGPNLHTVSPVERQRDVVAVELVAARLEVEPIPQFR